MAKETLLAASPMQSGDAEAGGQRHPGLDTVGR